MSNEKSNYNSIQDERIKSIESRVNIINHNTDAMKGDIANIKIKVARIESALSYQQWLLGFILVALIGLIFKTLI